MFKSIFKKFKKENYIVNFCVREGNSYSIMKRVRIEPTTKKIKYDKDNTFIIDIENHAYRDRNKKYYCIDLNSKQINLKQKEFENEEESSNINGQVQLEKLEEEDFLSSRVYNMVFEDTIIEQLATATTKPIKHKYDYTALLIGLVIGALIGFIVKIFIPFP